jgi:hypothetical protein
MRVSTKIILVTLLATVSGCGSSKTPKTAGEKALANKRDNPLLTIALVNDKKLKFTHVGPMGTDVVDGEVGFVGHATSVTGPHYNVLVMLAWPTPKTCEMSIDYDSKGSSRTMTVSLTGFRDAKATRDGKAVALPVELPSGKQKVVITATCP